jgi:hypothetical protein
MPKRLVEIALRRLQGDMRNNREFEEGTWAGHCRVPADLTLDKGLTLQYDRETEQLLRQAGAAVRDDLRLEHIGDSIDDEVWRFACLSYLGRSEDQVSAFLAKFDQEPFAEPTLFPVHGLSVDQPFDFAGVTFLPLTPDLVPACSDLDEDPACRSLIQIEAVGTKKDAMVDRARLKARHALRVLRVALRRHFGMGSFELRFRLGYRATVGQTYSEWSLPSSLGFALDLETGSLETVAADALTAIMHYTRHDIEKRVVLALKWLERARFEDDLTVACLYLFFALEALLGNRGAEEKGSHLCFYRVVLGEVSGYGFRHPFETYLLYADVRSKAVHGSEAAPVSEDAVRRLEADVYAALYELVDFTRANNMAHHFKFLEALRTHEKAPKVVTWLEANFPRNHAGKPIHWLRFVDGGEAKSSDNRFKRALQQAVDADIITSAQLEKIVEMCAKKK